MQHSQMLETYGTHAMKRTILPRKYKATDVQDSYMRVAGFYNIWSWLTERKASRRGIQLAQIQDGESILEVAVGTGIVFDEIVKQNPIGQNAGIDLSSAMLARTAKRLHDYSRSNFHLQKASAYHLPFADSSFDLIISNYMFDLLPEPDFRRILTEFHRVLKPSGRVIITTFSFGARWYNHIWLWMARYLPGLLTGCRPIVLETYVPEADFQAIKVEAISQNTFPSAIIWMEKRIPD